MKFLVDTGADLTTLPDHLLPILGISKNKLHRSKTLGVGGISVVTYRFDLPISIGKRELIVAAMAVETKGKFSPLLLGKKDIFESKYSLIVDSNKKLTRFSKNF